jgi:hypothetical protein
LGVDVWWLWLLLGSWAVSASTFERGYSTLATLGLEPAIHRRLDRLLNLDPYFPDLLLRLGEEFERRAAGELNEFMCAELLDLEAGRADYLARSGRLNEATRLIVTFLSYLEPGWQQFGVMRQHLIDFMHSGEEPGLAPVVEALKRADRPRSQHYLWCELEAASLRASLGRADPRDPAVSGRPQ